MMKYEGGSETVCKSGQLDEISRGGANDTQLRADFVNKIVVKIGA